VVVLVIDIAMLVWFARQ